MYLFKFIVITLIYAWGHAFRIGTDYTPNIPNYHSKFITYRTHSTTHSNYRQLENFFEAHCRPNCFISVVSAQGWHNYNYPDYDNYDAAYQNNPNVAQQRSQTYNAEETSRSYTVSNQYYREQSHPAPTTQQPRQQLQHQVQQQQQSSCQCTRLNDCPSILESIYRSQISISDWLLANLPDPNCGFYPNDAVVCCPRQQKAAKAFIKSTTEKPWIWEITRNVPDTVKRKNENRNNFEQGYERWDHTQFHKITAALPATPTIQPRKPNQNRNRDDDYQQNLVDFEDPDTRKNCPPSFYDEFEIPFSKPQGAQKRKAGQNRKNVPNGVQFRGTNRPPTRRRVQTQGTQLNQVNNHQTKLVSRQPVKRFVNSPLCGVSVNTRIVGGREIAPGQFPWMARLAYRNRTSGKLTYRCAGSVISDRYIVTAAHCVTNLVNSLEVFLVRVGELDTTRNFDCEQNPITCVVPQDYDIQKIIPHEKYDTPKYANDIALIRLLRPLNAAQITPICLPVDELSNADKKLTGQTGIIAGWGSKVAGIVSAAELNFKSHASICKIVDVDDYCDGGVRQNPSLQYVLLPIVNRTKCAASYAQFSANSRSPIIVTKSQICAQGMENMDACQGDSGGPLMIEGPNTNARFTLLGLVSFGPRTCGVSNFPGVYTRISSYVDWIAANME